MARTLPFVEFVENEFIYGELLASRIDHPQTPLFIDF